MKFDCALSFCLIFSVLSQVRREAESFPTAQIEPLNTISFLYVTILQSALSDIVKNNAIAFRWPTATVACPAGRSMLGGGGRCV